MTKAEAVSLLMNNQYYRQGYKQGVADVLDEIRTEFLAKYPKNYMGEPECDGTSCVFSLNKVLEIIDKCRNEVEKC